MLLLRTQRTHTFLEEDTTYTHFFGRKTRSDKQKTHFLRGKDSCKKVCTLHKLRRYINSKRLDGKIAVITGGSNRRRPRHGATICPRGCLRFYRFRPRICVRLIAQLQRSRSKGHCRQRTCRKGPVSAAFIGTQDE